MLHHVMLLYFDNELFDVQLLNDPRFDVTLYLGCPYLILNVSLFHITVGIVAVALLINVAHFNIVLFNVTLF